MRPMVCFDESPTRFIGQAREPIPAVPGQPERYDCQHRRSGAVNRFVFLDAHQSWRDVMVTEQRTAQDLPPACALADRRCADPIRQAQQCRAVGVAH